MSNLFLLLIIILFLTINILKKKHPNNQFLGQLGIAILVGAIIIDALMTDSGSKPLMYIIVVFGMIIIIGIVIDVVNFNKNQPKS